MIVQSKLYFLFTTLQQNYDVGRINVCILLTCYVKMLPNSWHIYMWLSKKLHFHTKEGQGSTLGSENCEEEKCSKKLFAEEPLAVSNTYKLILLLQGKTRSLAFFTEYRGTAGSSAAPSRSACSWNALSAGWLFNAGADDGEMDLAALSEAVHST